MRPSPASHPGRRPVVAFALLVGALSACAERDPLGLREVARIEIEAPKFALRPGTEMVATATAFNRFGHPLDRVVAWSSRTPDLLAVEATGLVRALAPGAGILRASVGGVTEDLVISQENPPIAVLTFEVDSLVVPLPGNGVVLSPRIEDVEGLPIIGAPIVWASSAPRIAAVSSTGAVAPAAVGRTTISATVGGQSATLALIVEPLPSGTAPLINTVTPSLIVPGVPVVITGERFGPMPAMNTVLVDGIALNVTAASTVQLTAVLPTGSELCLPTATVALQVGTSGGVGASLVTLSLAPERTLDVGQSLVFTSAAQAACNELTSSEGRYLLAISNGARALGAGPIGVTLAGRTAAVGGVDPTVVAASSVSTQADALAGRARSRQMSGAALGHARRADAHLIHLERTRAGFAAASAAMTSELGVATSSPTAQLQLPAPQGIVPVRVPNLDVANPCQNYIPGLAGRAVFIGDYIVILEDTATTVNGEPTLAGQMDGYYEQLGAEIEGTIWPIVTKFGDPLVMDDRLDDNGRVFLFFTPQMNLLQGGDLLGAVVNCDFFPRAQLASSNVGEILYAQVPLNPDPTTAEGTRDRWYHEIRTVVAHELKHVVAFAERLVRNLPGEELWLEEATARIAEELYARTYTGNIQGGNAVYASGLQCEVRYGEITPGCEGAPRAMVPHFEALWSFLDAPATHSPLGGNATGDRSFYGSGWALTRWVLDQSATPENALLRDLTVSSATGLANLETRAGSTWNEMQGRWAAALMTDDRAGMTPPAAPLDFPSWNLADVYAGLCADLGPCGGGAPQHPFFGRAHPLAPSLRSAGSFDVNVPAILPGGFHAVQITGGSNGIRQLLHLRGLGGAALPVGARLAIVRVQ
jgi:hypothetical protein